MVNRVIILVFVLNLTIAWSLPKREHFIEKREKFCGKKLEDTLAVVCGNKYFSPSKKSYNDVFNYGEYEEFFPNENDDNQFDFPFLQKEQANSLIPMRFRRGIIQECCHKPCSLTHLRLYCE